MKTFRIDYEINGISHIRVLQAKTLEDAVDIIMTDYKGAKVIAVR